MVHFIEIDGWTWINILIKRLKIETGKLRLFFQLFPKAVTFFVGGEEDSTSPNETRTTDGGRWKILALERR